MGIFSEEIRELTWNETINWPKYYRVCIGINDLLNRLKSMIKKKGFTWSIKPATGYYPNCFVL